MSTSAVISSTRTVATEAGHVDVAVTEQGEGRPFLVLHGGAGPLSVAAFATRLATTRQARVFTPTHPGFSGTSRPDHLAGIRGLAAVYTALLDELELTDVTVVGNSIGGWTAAEIALLGSPRITGVVLVDAVGLRLDSSPIADFFALSLDEVAQLSYYEPDRFRIDVANLSDAARALMAGNRAALLAYGGTGMNDDSLLGRLPTITLPTLVVWGAADRVVGIEHGRAYAAAIPNATFDLIETAGHLPQLESPERLIADVWAFAEQHSGR